MDKTMIHYAEQWPDDVSDQLQWHDDYFGDVDEWLDHIASATNVEEEVLRANPDGRLTAEMTRFVSVNDRWGGWAQEIAEGLLENEELHEDFGTGHICDELKRVLDPALKGLSSTIGWYESCCTHVYITAREVLVMIDKADAWLAALPERKEGGDHEAE